MYKNRYYSMLYIICDIDRGHSFGNTNKIYKIDVDLGKNIARTAKESGAPHYDKESHWGLYIYELVNLRKEMIVTFDRPGYQIVATPLFSLTMYADKENKNDLAVDRIHMQYHHKAITHEKAKQFIEDIVTQFNRGKWRRYLSDTCRAVSGRSTYLDEAGKIEFTCPLDPTYRISMDDWKQLMKTGSHFEWFGDGMLARLTVDFDEDADSLTYNIELEIQDFSILGKRVDAQQARELIEGDQKGWKSTESFHKGMKENQSRIKILEANAIRRGDHLVSRD